MGPRSKPDTARFVRAHGRGPREMTATLVQGLIRRTEVGGDLVNASSRAMPVQPVQLGVFAPSFARAFNAGRRGARVARRCGLQMARSSGQPLPRATRRKRRSSCSRLRRRRPRRRLRPSRPWPGASLRCPSPERFGWEALGICGVLRVGLRMGTSGNLRCASDQRLRAATSSRLRIASLDSTAREVVVTCRALLEVIEKHEERVRSRRPSELGEAPNSALMQTVALCAPAAHRNVIVSEGGPPFLERVI